MKVKFLNNLNLKSFLFFIQASSSGSMAPPKKMAGVGSNEGASKQIASAADMVPVSSSAESSLTADTPAVDSTTAKLVKDETTPAKPTADDQTKEKLVEKVSSDSASGVFLLLLLKIFTFVSYIVFFIFDYFRKEKR